MLQTHFPNASRLVYGCMGLGGSWDSSAVTSEHIEQARKVIETALDSGINVFDHADIYTFGKAEKAFGEVLRQSPGLRERMVLQSKCAIRFEDESGPKRYDFSAGWVRQAVEGCLKRLAVDKLDVLLLHRPDPLMELDELCATLCELLDSGKILYVGVSNMHWQQIQYLQSALPMPLVANQLEMSLAHRDWLEDGITTGSTANRQMGYATGTLEYCMQHDVQLQAWGSLGQGRYTGGSSSDINAANVMPLVQRLAAEYQVAAEAIVLAWLTRHPARIQPVIGTTNLSRIQACAQTSQVNLSREHWYELLQAARGEEVP